MKNKFTLILSLSLTTILLIFAGGLKAQNCEAFYPMKQGSEREMKSYDKKDKLTGTNKQKVISVKDIEGGIAITVENQSFDSKDKLISMDNLTLTCQNGIFKVDMKNYLDPAAMKSMEGLEVSVDTRELEFPSDLQAGQQLRDGFIKMVASNMGIPMLTILVKIYDRKVDGMEDVTTPAGTFKCYKISQTTEVKSIGKYTAKNIDWISKDVGTVKSETYDKNDKLIAHSVLTEIK